MDININTIIKIIIIIIIKKMKCQLLEALGSDHILYAV